MNGPEYETVEARPVLVPQLPSFLPQIRARSDNGGPLTEPVYGVRAFDVLRNRGVRSADDLRAQTGLSTHQQLVVLLFDRDLLLEQLWDDGMRLIPGLASAGYDLIVAPSYSAWTPRPRTEFMYSAKRSLEVFRLLQRFGANVIPRLVWNIEADVLRAAQWVTRNPGVAWIALDLATYRDDTAFAEQVEGLARFDSLTGQRMQYLINGPGTAYRCAQLYAAAHEDRLRITSTTFAAPPEQVPEGQLEFAIEEPPDGIGRRCAAKRRILAEAAATVARDRARELALAA